MTDSARESVRGAEAAGRAGRRRCRRPQTADDIGAVARGNQAADTRCSRGRWLRPLATAAGHSRCRGRGLGRESCSVPLAICSFSTSGNLFVRCFSRAGLQFSGGSPSRASRLREGRPRFTRLHPPVKTLQVLQGPLVAADGHSRCRGPGLGRVSRCALLAIYSFPTSGNLFVRCFVWCAGLQFSGGSPSSASRLREGRPRFTRLPATPSPCQDSPSATGADGRSRWSQPVPRARAWPRVTLRAARDLQLANCSFSTSGNLCVRCFVWCTGLQFSGGSPSSASRLREERPRFTRLPATPCPCQDSPGTPGAAGHSRCRCRGRGRGRGLGRVSRSVVPIPGP